MELWNGWPRNGIHGEHFNFAAFSPRSALLLHAFNISISQVQGTFHMHESNFEAPIAVGFRPLWQDWESNGRTLGHSLEL